MRIEQRYWLAALVFCLLWILGVVAFGSELSGPVVLALIVVGAVIASFISALPYLSWLKEASLHENGSDSQDHKAHEK